MENENKNLMNLEELSTNEFYFVKKYRGGELTAVIAQPIILKEYESGGLTGFLKNNKNQYMGFHSENTGVNKIISLANKDKKFAKIKGIYSKDVGEIYKVYGIALSNLIAEVKDTNGNKVNYKEH